jgi:V-type H+-transporting ATPase subunit d
MEMSFFNIQDGLGEAFARNFRRGLLQPQDYQALSNCESLDDLKMALCNNPNTPFQGDDPRDFGYKDWLEDWEPEANTEGAVRELERLLNRGLCAQYEEFRTNSVGKQREFLEFLTHEYRIHNMMLLMKSAIKKSAHEMAHGEMSSEDKEAIFREVKQLGLYAQHSAEIPDNDGGLNVLFATLQMADEDPKQMINTLIEKCEPIGKYFIEGFGLDGVMTCEGEELLEKDLDLVEGKVMRKYLQDFYDFTQTCGPTTASVMHELLSFEADRRAIVRASNRGEGGDPSSQMTEVDMRMFDPDFGGLNSCYGEGFIAIANLHSTEEINRWLQDSEHGFAKTYGACVDVLHKQGDDALLEEVFLKYAVRMYELVFDEQFHYGVLYAALKLKEQEIRNLTWIAEMINTNNRAHIDKNVVHIFPEKGEFL